MTTEAFEQLVCESLDEPGRDDVRAAVDAAIARRPDWAALRDEWSRLDTLLRRNLELPAIDWKRLRLTWASAPYDDRSNLRATPPASDARRATDLDGLLAGATDVSRAVNWNELHARISRTVLDSAANSRDQRAQTAPLVVASDDADRRRQSRAARTATPRTIRFRILSLTTLAAAAALALMIGWPRAVPHHRAPEIAAIHAPPARPDHGAAPGPTKIPADADADIDRHTAQPAPSPADAGRALVARIESADRSPSTTSGRVVASINAPAGGASVPDAPAIRAAAEPDRFMMIDAAEHDSAS